MRGAIKGRFALRELESLAFEDGEHSKQIPQDLLAHPTVTVTNFTWLAGNFISD